MTTTTTLPRFIPCPEDGLDGVRIERGPYRGVCRYQAERMDSTVVPTYYRCPIHGTAPWILARPATEAGP